MLADRDRDKSENVFRAAQYREALDDLSDAAFLFACKRARDLLDWIPTVRKLRKLAHPQVQLERDDAAKKKRQERHEAHKARYGTPVLGASGVGHAAHNLLRSDPGPISKEDAAKMLQGTSLAKRFKS